MPPPASGCVARSGCTHSQRRAAAPAAEHRPPGRAQGPPGGAGAAEENNGNLWDQWFGGNDDHLLHCDLNCGFELANQARAARMHLHRLPLSLLPPAPLTAARLQCLGEVLANFIARVTIPGETTQTTTGTFVPSCPNPLFFVPGCVTGSALDGFKFSSAITCNNDGALMMCTGTTVPGCCTSNNMVSSVCTTATFFGISPDCELSGPGTVTTITTASVTVPGFFADACTGTIAPGGCLACFHCCKQAYGKDSDAVALCKASFCNTQRIVTRCALRATLCAAARRRFAACRALRSGLPCVQHTSVPDHLRDVLDDACACACAGADADTVSCCGARLQLLPASIPAVCARVDKQHFERMHTLRAVGPMHASACNVACACAGCIDLGRRFQAAIYLP
jgi:hypothetical protein